MGALIYYSFTLKVEARGSSETLSPADKTEGITSQRNITLTPLTDSNKSHKET